MTKVQKPTYREKARTKLQATREVPMAPREEACSTGSFQQTMPIREALGRRERIRGVMVAQIGALGGEASHCRPVVCLSEGRAGEGPKQRSKTG